MTDPESAEQLAETVEQLRASLRQIGGELVLSQADLKHAQRVSATLRDQLHREKELREIAGLAARTVARAAVRGLPPTMRGERMVVQDEATGRVYEVEQTGSGEGVVTAVLDEGDLPARASQEPSQ